MGWWCKSDYAHPKKTESFDILDLFSIFKLYEG